MLHKLLTRIFLARVLLRTLDEAQPAELDSARDSAACITSISKIIEFFQEYRMRLVFAFIEYDKAFNSTETNAVSSAFIDQGAGSSYMKALHRDARQVFSCSTTP